MPSVIEPSFGIGRIIYCMFEHCFYMRDDARTAFRFTPVVAPVKATVFPLLQRAELNEVAAKMAAALTAEGLATVVDTTGAWVMGLGRLGTSMMQEIKRTEKRVFVSSTYGCFCYRCDDWQAVCTDG